MTKHSLKIVIVAVALTILAGATPSLAAGDSQSAGSHLPPGWVSALDLVEGWLDAVFTAITSSAVQGGEQQEGSPDPTLSTESGPDVDPNGDAPPEVDPTGGTSAERGPDVDPNG